MKRERNQPTSNGPVVRWGGVFLLVLFVVSATSLRVTAQQKQTGLSKPVQPQYENLFNCLCQIKNKNGEVDASRNCGKALHNCSCGFAKKMRDQLQELDRKGLGRNEQIKRMKEKYKHLGKRVLAVPDPSGSEVVIGYVIPPALIFLALLFIGGLGWYWMQNTDSDQPDAPSSPSPEDRAAEAGDLEEEIEREIEQRKEDL